MPASLLCNPVLELIYHTCEQNMIFRPLIDW